jgi:predicted transcriptional regulator
MTAEEFEGLLREKIRDAMLRKGMKQVDIAHALGIKPSRVSELISGKRGRLPESLLRLLDCLDLELCVKERGSGR